MLDTVTLDQLRMFIAVADEGSFSAAARRVQRVQSAVSHAMANLESMLGLVLWDRSSRIPILTDEGRAVLAEARRIAAGVDHLRHVATSLAGGREAVLSVCVDQLFPTTALVALCREFAKAFTDVELRLQVELLNAVGHAVRSGEADLGIISPTVDRAGLVTQHVTTVRMVTVAGSGHPLALERGRLPLELLREHVQIVVSERGVERVRSVGTGEVESAKRKRGEDPRPGVQTNEHSVLSARTWRVADMVTKHELIKSGLGWGNLPLHMAKRDITRGRLVRIRPAAWDARGIPIELSAAHRSDRVLGPAGRWVSKHLGSLCRQAIGQRGSEPG